MTATSIEVKQSLQVSYTKAEYEVQNAGARTLTMYHSKRLEVESGGENPFSNFHVRGNFLVKSCRATETFLRRAN